MKIKKLLCIVLAFAMVLCTMGTVVFAEEMIEEDKELSVEQTIDEVKELADEQAIDVATQELTDDTEEISVAKVGNTQYSSIDQAIAAWTNGSNLTLLADVTLSDVITIKSTEHHILNLGTYTMTAASGKNAIEISCNGRSSASYALTINADSNNPGGITAVNNSCIYYRKTASTKDRPIITINGGVFNGSYSINSYSSNKGTNCPQVVINGGTFNGYINLTNAMFRTYGGTFNCSINATGDVSAYRQFAGGTFQKFTFLTAGPSGSEQKLTFGKDKNVYNVGLYVDDNDYLVVGSDVIAGPGETFEASTSYGVWSSYLQYSSAKDNRLYYTDADVAIAKAKYPNEIKLFTSYSEELELSSSKIFDITDENAEFTSNVKLIDASITFTLKLNSLDDYHGVVTPADGYELNVEQSVDAETGAIQLTFSNYKNLNETNSGAKIANGDTTTYYETVTDAIYAADGTKGTIITLLADDTTATLITNGRAAVADGATEVTIDLNGFDFGLSGTAIGNSAKYNITITDLSDAQTGSVVTDIARLMKFVPSGSGDYSGTFELVAAGGIWCFDPSSYEKDGVEYNFLKDNYVMQDDGNGGYYLYDISTDKIKVEFEKVDNGVYDIYLNGGNGKLINELVSAQLTFVNNSKLLDGKTNLDYTVTGTEEFDVQLDNLDQAQENADTQDETETYAFSANPKAFENYDAVNDEYYYTYKTASKIKIGTVTFDGFGTTDFVIGVNADAPNFVKTTVVNTNNEFVYVTDGDINNRNKLVVDAEIVGDKVGPPMRDVQINIDFKNDLSGVKDALYNDMTVVVENAKLGYQKTFKIGNGTSTDEVTYIADYTNTLATMELNVFAGYQYTVTLTGAGYRTYRYVTTIDESDDKLVLTFWNNAKFESGDVDPFIPVEKGGKAIRTTFLAGDISMDNIIDKYDLAAVVSYFGTYNLSASNNPQYAKYDLNRDGKIDAEDIAYVLYSFGY